MEIMASLMGGLIFSGIGLVAFGRGRKNGNASAMVIGAALMVYPYLVPNAAAVYVIGTVLVGALFIFRD